MNCSSLAVETPQKLYIREKSQTPVKLKLDPDKRFSPSKPLQTLLESINRVHQYQFHLEFKILELTDIKISQKTVGEIKQVIVDESPDVSDLVLKVEEIAIAEGKFSSFLRNYISEEFEVDQGYSFLIICVLNYMDSFCLSVSESFFELLKLSNTDTLCQSCILGIDVCEKVKMAQIHNLGIYRTLLTNFDSGIDDIINHSDDSTNDMPYGEEDRETSQTSSLTEPSVFDFQVETETRKIFNPFDSSSSENSLPNQILNSTEFSNPFSDSETNIINPSDKYESCDKYKCEFCDKHFSNSYNRKLHLVSVHKIFPKGMFIYKCAFPSCKFVNGSKILYTRHVPTHTKEILLFIFRSPLTFLLYHSQV